VKTALLIVDFFSDFEFEGGDRLKKQAAVAARKLIKLKEKAKALRLPVIYVNDNFEHWRDDFTHQVDRLIERTDEAGQIARLLKPDESDYYVLKPQRSGFYSTPLERLLNSLKVKKLIIAGLSTDICVMFTAHDAYERGFEVAIPSDCTAAVDPKHKRDALQLLERVAKVDTTPSTDIDLAK
jgi:nicotinamidase-related amidase